MARSKVKLQVVLPRPRNARMFMPPFCSMLKTDNEAPNFAGPGHLFGEDTKRVIIVNEI